MTETYDYVVVGGGSSGCVAAAELSEDPSVRVLLLEAGDTSEAHPETLRADGYKDAFANDALMKERFSVHDERWGSRRLFMGSGRGIGGSGAINAMVYTRGAELDFDEWPRAWRWGEVTRDYEAIEARLRPRPRPPTEFTETCLDAAEAAGFTRKADLNDGDLGGVLGYEHMNYEGDDRRNSYVAFLRPALDRPNLDVRTGASVHRLVVGPRRVEGVRYEHDGALIEARASREVLMCAGALETPRLLMLSGIGPGRALRRVGLPSLFDVPGVGENLHDHPNVCVFFRGGRDVDCSHPQLYGFHRANPDSDLPPAMSDTCYVFYPARSSLREAMIRILPGLVLPEPLYDVGALPKAVRGGVDLAFRAGGLRAQVKKVFGIVVILGKPKSRGRVTLSSPDPKAPARIDPGYFADPEDMETMLKGVARARRVAGAAPLAAWGNREIFPGPLGQSDAALEGWIRKNVMTTYHYAGTCAMGDQGASVADDRLRVRGVEGLRIADAAAIPVTPVSALNAPSMLVGYRAARFASEERRAS
ncbi:MAG: GMC family oxidoreductase [Sandaracinaceae bacterium]|nr:GMC family oxidoreductase [Sandaracinaceae bacterium]